MGRQWSVQRSCPHDVRKSPDVTDKRGGHNPGAADVNMM